MSTAHLPPGPARPAARAAASVAPRSNLAAHPPAPSAFVQGIVEGFAGRAAALDSGAPAWLAQLRRAQLQELLRHGLPGARDERWKYTSLRALERRRLALADGSPPPAGNPIDPALLALEGIEGPRVVFVNGALDARLSRLDALPEGVHLRPLSAAMACADEDARLRRVFAAPPPGVEDAVAAADAFIAINTALAGEGVLLEVDAGCVVEPPLQVVCIGAAAPAPLLWNLRHLVALGAGAQLTLVEHFLDGGDGCSAQEHVGNVVGSIALGPRARLRHLRLQQAGATSSLLAHTRVEVAAGAEYRPVALEFGGALSRHEWDIVLRGAQAATSVRGVVLASGRQSCDTRLAVRHASGATQSQTLWRAIAGGRARSAFHGGITIDAGADHSDAALETKNLLLSEQAEIDAQPVLVIHADEVKASHGAAIGQLDPGALFYLRARGIPLARARNILVDAFCRAVFEADVPDADVRDADVPDADVPHRDAPDHDVRAEAAHAVPERDAPQRNVPHREAPVCKIPVREVPLHGLLVSRVQARLAQIGASAGAVAAVPASVGLEPTASATATGASIAPAGTRDEAAQ